MPALTTSFSPLAAIAADCPLNHGVFVLDQLLAALSENRDAAGLDAALDLRLALAGKAEPAIVLALFFRLRATVEESHYLACYRLRRWLDAHYVAHVQLDRSRPAKAVALQLAPAASLPALREQCIASAGGHGIAEFAARVRFAVAEPPR